MTISRRGIAYHFWFKFPVSTLLTWVEAETFWAYCIRVALIFLCTEESNDHMVSSCWYWRTLSLFINQIRYFQDCLLYLKSSKSSLVNLWSHVFNIFSVVCGQVSMPLILRKAEINSLMFFTMVMASGPREGTSSVLTLCLVANFRNRFCPEINKRGMNTPRPSCFELPIQPLYVNHLFLIFWQYFYIFPFRMYFFEYFSHVCGML